MLSEIIRSSFFLSLPRRIGKNVLSGGPLRRAFPQSRTYMLLRRYYDAVTATFDNSFVGRIGRIKKDADTGMIDNSRVICKIRGAFGSAKYKVPDYLDASAIGGWIRGVMKDLYLFPVKSLSIIILTGVIANIAFCASFRIGISIAGWFTRGLFLLMGIGGISCPEDWPALRENSFILRWIFRK